MCRGVPHCGRTPAQHTYIHPSFAHIPWRVASNAADTVASLPQRLGLTAARHARIYRALAEQHVHDVAILLPHAADALSDLLHLSIGDAATLANALDRYEERDDPDEATTQSLCNDDDLALVTAIGLSAAATRRVQRALQRCGTMNGIEGDGRLHAREWNLLKRKQCTATI